MNDESAQMAAPAAMAHDPAGLKLEEFLPYRLNV
jgi:hypothetical protein